MADPTPVPADLTGRRWTFGSALLDERSLQLEVSGERVPLERKPLEVLLYLLHHAGEVVTKDDLAENLWPGRVLTETVLTRCISVLRQVLKDDDRTLIRTVHGYGYRLVTDVKVEASTASAPPALDFRPGDHPPLRPQWKLVERLGAGGHGEAWLARHEKTGDARVFKFARDASALTSLKREITLYRLLHDTLGTRAAIARILEWNLAEPPYFIEMEYVAGGNLQAWSEAQGGLAGIPLEVRLELVAQIAEALAAAHSVGALHKDLKPGNVLIHVDNGRPVVRLCDFGSGGVLDPQRLEQLGITRLGFTKTLADGAAGTPLYLAPEIVSGQPFTVQADVYALGVLFYQLAVCDLCRPLAPGWEEDVGDELLREDIALAAAGNPMRRLTSAGHLAERLRTLEARHEARAVEAAARQRAELTRRALAELRRTRVYMALLLGLTVFAVSGGVIAYRARADAAAATNKAEAISAFLMDDVLGVDSSVDRPRPDTYTASLDRAAAQVDGRFTERPDAAAKVHWLLGRRYEEVEEMESAATQYEAAAAIYERVRGPNAHDTLLAKERLASLYADQGKRKRAQDLARELQIHWQSASQVDVVTLIWRVRVGKLLLLCGDVSGAEKELMEVIERIPQSPIHTEAAMLLFRQWFGSAPKKSSEIRDALHAHANEILSAAIGELEDRYEQAESRARIAFELSVKLAGEESQPAVTARLRLAAALLYRGKYEEAEAHIARVTDFYDKSLPATHAIRGVPTYWMARVRLEQQRPSEALALFSEGQRMCGANCPSRRRYAYESGLGEANADLGHLQEAMSHYRTAASMLGSIEGPRHVLHYSAQIGLADALRRSGQATEAEAVLRSIDNEVVDQLRRHPMRAKYYRVVGLLALTLGNNDRAAAALEKSAAILREVVGRDHWRSQVVISELARARDSGRP